MSEHVEAARKVRAALRAAFPKVKMSITSDYGNGIRVEWSDDTGVSLDAVKTVLAAAPFVEADRTWNDQIYFKAGTETIAFDCYNVAEREAIQRDMERSRQEREEQGRREKAVIDRAWEIKRSAFAPCSDRSPQPKSDPAVFAAFDRLRERAEVTANFEEEEGDERTRRPSWAPPLILGEELAEACLELGWLTMDDKWIGRLWAHFASPQRKQRYFRKEVSQHPLRGIPCRGFQLFAGSTRQSVREILFEAQREESGEWRFGPPYHPVYYNPRSDKWESLIRERERLHHETKHYQLSEERRKQVEFRLADIASEIEAIDAQDMAEAEKRRGRQRLRQRVYELARTRVLDFVGAPGAQMEKAARLWGHCCCCGKALTDPLSLERGIGPECYGTHISFIKFLLSDGRSRENIHAVFGIAVELIDAVLRDTGNGERS
jgi:hypothetical protein